MKITYKDALERNESREGLSLADLSLADLLGIIEEIPGWDYPLADECMGELARRAGIDQAEYFRDDDDEDSAPHGYDYNDLYADCVGILRNGGIKYRVLPEYVDLWFGGLSTDEIGDPVLTLGEIEDLCSGWGIPVESVMDQVEEV